ncbi:hypothetical protein N7462_009887 [Penicillium macrosclerotiorum]|uniref:uncharacterized protein n=1 Tax=Penicillium macrosclerotiorum TaxID=303699 RepID=UPI0025491AC4|nr:uncharacterized protein N7462_009887 [Penicillium macrosclerotiorum]KAJ5668817.1 hypothetical protein N7462_009887 [Penicillium macrosclerotiorum]
MAAIRSQPMTDFIPCNTALNDRIHTIVVLQAAQRRRVSVEQIWHVEEVAVGRQLARNQLGVGEMVTNIICQHQDARFGVQSAAWI